MVRGSCLCGGVRFEVDGQLGRATHCHCSMCRKAHGAAFGTYARVQAAEFRWTAGEELVAKYESSPGVTRTFCARCGSTLQWLWSGAPDRLAIALGVVDGDPGVRPEAHIFVASKAPWHDIADDLPRYSESY